MGAAASTIFLRVCSPFVIHLCRIRLSETDRSLLIIALRLFGCLLGPNGLTQSRHICDRSVPSTSNHSEGRTDDPDNGTKGTDPIEDVECGVRPGLLSDSSGTGSGSSRILRHHAAAHQPGGGHYNSKRTGYPAAEPLPGKRPVEEYGHADRAVAEKRHGTGSPVQPRADRSQPSERRCPRRAVASALRVVAATGSACPSGLRKPQLQRDRS